MPRVLLIKRYWDSVLTILKDKIKQHIYKIFFLIDNLKNRSNYRFKSTRKGKKKEETKCEL